MICLSIKGKNEGKIFYLDDKAIWDGEEDWYNNIPVSEEIKYQHIYFIANSFIEFLEMLYINPDM